MKLTYKEDHLSIENFNGIELADFTVLTGLNGSGKTQLLNAIKNQKVLIDGAYTPVSRSKIVLFDKNDFNIQEQKNPYGGNDWSSARKNAFGCLDRKSSNHHPFLSNISLNQDDENHLKKYAKKYDKKLLELIEDDVKIALSDNSKYLQYQDYKTDQIIQAQNLGLDKEEFINKSIFIKDLINNEDLFNQLWSGVKNNDGLFVTSLSKLFFDYYNLFDSNNYNRYKKSQNEDYSKEPLSDDDFFKRHGDRPWEIINKLLDELSTNNITLSKYRINEPKHRDIPYKASLINPEDSKVGFENLSSGEQVLISLIISTYKSTLENNQFPDVILLDEIDASLHPSMCKYLLNTIKEIFIKKGSKVILTTHSPTTVALTEEESIYVMKPNGENRVQKVSKTEAIKELSHGFISIASEEANHNISYNIGKSEKDYILLTEGITDKIILEKAWKKLYSDKTMPFDIQDCFCASVLGELIKRNEIYSNYPDKNFIALFDYDQAGYIEQWKKLKSFDEDIQNSCKFKKHSCKKGYAMLLPTTGNEELISENDNRLTKSGICIENLLYSNKTSNHFNQDKKFIGCKKTFSEKVIDNSDQNDLSLFKEIFETIELIIPN